MKFNTPLPQTLPKECQKASKIFKSFVDGSNNGLDGVIPRHVLENAKGFAIFTIIKAGFVFSARAGTGIVIAKLPDGTWSCPSAIGTAGLGVGMQLGSEVTDFLIVLNSRSAVKSFMASGSLTLGGNLSIALGPLGRNGEALGSVNTSGKVAAMYSYSKTRGLFGGLSVEAGLLPFIVEREDANVQAYGSQVTSKLLLNGGVDPPPWAASFIKTLEVCTGLPGTRQWVNEDGPDRGYAFATPTSETPPSYLRKKRKESKSDFPPASWGEQRDSGSYFSQQVEGASLRGKPKFDNPAVDEWGSPSSERPRSTIWDTAGSSAFPTQFQSDFVSDSHRPNKPFTSPTPSTPGTVYDLVDTTPQVPMFGHADNQSHHSRSSSSAFSQTAPAPAPVLLKNPALSQPLPSGLGRAIALFDFNAVQSGDLSFSKGDIIVITKRSESSDDWWTGMVDGRKGIFPANFVDVVG
ncbi:unnamed protein product [Mycena citricolor]|uniref:SH3 domain-containing protein n=1 Tax=Mycena citricolor TaxID=2018698 RepID=A0AAD2HRM7_9AGAR|nr:unnamed protein product [Mycena citricolor]